MPLDPHIQALMEQAGMLAQAGSVPREPMVLLAEQRAAVDNPFVHHVSSKGALKQGFPGQAQPVPYTMHDYPPYRVRAGLAPALVLCKI